MINIPGWLVDYLHKIIIYAANPKFLFWKYFFIVLINIGVLNFPGVITMLQF